MLEEVLIEGRAGKLFVERACLVHSTARRLFGLVATAVENHGCLC